jgi:guanine deaminase
MHPLCSIVLAEAFQAVGVRGFVGKLSMDQSSRPTYVESSVADSLAAARSFIQRCNGIVAHLSPQERLVEPVITPRFVPTCSDELLAGLGKLSNIGSVKIQSHMHESREQAEWVKSENGIEDVEVFHKVCSARAAAKPH